MQRINIDSPKSTDDFLMKLHMIQHNKFDLPENVRRQLDRRCNDMDYIAQLAIKALDEQSNVYGYTVYKAISTIASVSLLKETTELDGMISIIEESLSRMTYDYLLMMQQVPRESWEKIVKVLQSIPPKPNSDNAIKEVLAVIMQRLQG